MSERAVLTIDVGSGSCRALLFSPDGRQLAMRQREWTLPSLPDVPGGLDFDTRDAWEQIRDCIVDVLDASKRGAEDVQGVTATSFREGMVLYDADGEEIWACPNVDKRGKIYHEEMEASGLADRIYEIGGDWLSIISPPRFRWLRDHRPEVLERTRRMTMISDWVLYRLCGRFVTEPSVGSSSGIFDLENRTWSEELVDRLELPWDWFPEIVEPGEVVGEIHQRAAEETGLRPGTPVVTSGADTQLALVGVGGTEAGQITVVGGSHWQTTILSDQPLIDPERRPRTLCHTEPGVWMTEGIGFLSGFALRWFRDAFCEAEVRRAGEEGKSAFEMMEERARRVPVGSRGVWAIMADVMNAKNWVHATPSFLQFDVTDPDAIGKAACYRALLEATGYTVMSHHDILTELAGRETEDVVFCGGASNSSLWSRIVCDQLGKPVRVPEVKEATALAAGLYTWVGLGHYADVEEAVEEAVRWEKQYDPDPDSHRRYQSLHERWKTIYPRVKEITEELELQPLE